MPNEQDVQIAQRSAATICSMIREFIAPDVREDAQKKLAKSLLESGVELTARAMRLDYEAMKKA